MAARKEARALWRDRVRKYAPTHFAVIPAGESRPERVLHLFSCGHLAEGNCRWYAFENARQHHRFLLDHPNARSCDNPVKDA